MLQPTWQLQACVWQPVVCQAPVPHQEWSGIDAPPVTTSTAIAHWLSSRSR